MIQFFYFVILTSVSLYLVFKKAGIKPWYALIPGLNVWQAADLSNRSVVVKVGSSLFFVFATMQLITNLFFGKATLVQSIQSISPFAPAFFGILLIVSVICYFRTAYFLFRSFGKSVLFSQAGVFFAPLFLLSVGLDKSTFSKNEN